MKFSILSFTLAGLVGRGASYTYDPNGAILGDFTTTELTNPHVVLNYLASCADIKLPDFETCVLDEFIAEHYSDGFMVGECDRIPLDLTPIGASLNTALATCNSTGDIDDDSIDETELMMKLASIMGNLTCRESLCRDDIHIDLEATWISTCAGLDLPFPLPSSEEMLISSEESYRQDAFVTCMLDYVMDQKPSFFNLTDPQDGSAKACYPPGFMTSILVCPTIGAVAYEYCSTKVTTEEMFPMMMMMSMSMSFDFGPSDETSTISAFCDIYTALSSEEKRVCLLDLCDYNQTDAPTSSPSSSLPPTIVPTPMPTPSPTPMPTTSPTPIPTPLPTPLPTTLPTGTPTSNPSAAPTSAPSMAGSSVPTFDSVQAVAGVTFFSSFRLNLTEDEIPRANSIAFDLFVEVLETALVNVTTPLTGTANATVTSIGTQSIVGIRMRRLRRLDDSASDFVEVDFRMTATRDCFVDDCMKEAMRVFEDYSQAFNTSERSSRLTAAIQAQAKGEGVPELETAEVVTGSFQVTSSNTFVEDVETETGEENDDDDTSAAVTTHFIALGIATLIACFFI